MHTRMSCADLIWWLAILGIQACLAACNRHTVGALRVFLAAETVMSTTLFVIARAAGPWTYFYSWVVGTVIHHGLCAFLMWKIFMAVRLRGLPGRQGMRAIVFMGAASLLLGLRYADISYCIVRDPTIRLIMPMDHALSFAIGCMLAALPFYAIFISSSIPRSLNMVIAGMAIYEFSYAGLLGAVMNYNPKTFSHAVDFVYLLSLFLWSLSLHSKRPLVAAEYSTMST